MPESDRYFLVEGRERFRAGSKAYGRVVRLLPFDGQSDELHDELRQSLMTLRGAMNYLEDEDMDLFEKVHALLDTAGRLAREEFPAGCQLSYHDNMYHQACPVALAHNRSGLSVGMKVRARECSICHQDPEDCEHIRGRVYDGRTCTHFITDAEIMEVSIVGKPAQPDARFTAISVGMGQIRAKLGPKFRPGMPVTCDRCLSQCNGISWPFRDGPK